MDPRIMELRIKKWIPVIEEQVKSGISKRKWCTMHGIDQTSFFRWQKRVREYLLDQGEACPSQPLSSIPSDQEADFVELPSAQDSPVGTTGRSCEETVWVRGFPPSISIRYKDFSIDFHGDVGEKQLSMVLEVLKHAD